MRLIDADALPVYRVKILHAFGIIEGNVIFPEDVKNAPTIDAEPVRHGRWSDSPYRYECEGCGKWLLLEDGTADMNYCPDCGAKMDGGADNA